MASKPRSANGRFPEKLEAQLAAIAKAATARGPEQAVNHLQALRELAAACDTATLIALAARAGSDGAS